jgi:putative flavoprotein involved in K+ transport
MAQHTLSERVDVAVIGGGQAGLASGGALVAHGIECRIFDAGARIGDQWRTRWDSLRLFTPAAFDALPGMPFPADPTAFPSKDQMADYLEAYAEHLALPVESGVRVTAVERAGSDYLLETAQGGRIEARQVIVATGAHAVPHVPEVAASMAPEIQQVHSAEYRDPTQLVDGPVLVVGAGNSGAEIAMELARAGRPTFLAGRSTGHVPAAAYAGGGRLFLWVARHVLTLQTPIGRRIRSRALSTGGPLIGLTMGEVIGSGVRRVGRIERAVEGRPAPMDGPALDVAAIVWATGFDHDFSWIHRPVLDEHGWPVQRDGAAAGEPGLYFVGLPFETGILSALVGGVGHDAELVAQEVSRRMRASLARPALARTA